MFIDAHQHFWKYDPFHYDWISDQMSVIRKDFLPENIFIELKNNNIQGCIAVQAQQTELETEFLIELANKNSFIKGIVGWVDLFDENIKDRLDYFSKHKMIKGFREVLQNKDPGLMFEPSFIRGIKTLLDYHFTYDLLITPQHLKAACQLAKKFPDQLFVIDHLAKPFIKEGKIQEWKEDMKEISKCKNVYCKISGMVTEADYSKWKETEIIPYIDVVVQFFGPDRIMFGSDWPVCLVAASYQRATDMVKKYFSTFSEIEQQQFFGDNAITFYKL